MIQLVELKAKTYSYLKKEGSEDKKTKSTKKCVKKRKSKFQNYKNCLEATQLENKKNYLEKNKIGIDNLRKDHKEFIKSNKLILKTQQIFKSERYNGFTEEINKIQ